MDGSTLAAAALYDLKNEQLQLASNSLQQQHVSGERAAHDASRAEESATNQSAGTNSEAQQFTNDGKRVRRSLLSDQSFLSRHWDGSRNSIWIRSISPVQRTLSQFTPFPYLESSHQNTVAQIWYCSCWFGDRLGSNRRGENIVRYVPWHSFLMTLH